MRVCFPDRATTLTLPGQAPLRDELIAAGAWIPGGCRNGNCGICEATLIQGSVRRRDGAAPPASGERFMLCTHQALTDLSLRSEAVLLPGEQRQETLWARQLQCETLSPRWTLLRLLLPAGKRLPVYAGQGIELLGEDGRSTPAYLSAPPGRELECWLDAPPLSAPARLQLRLPWGDLQAHPFDGDIWISCSEARLPQALALLRQHALWRRAAHRPLRALLWCDGRLPVALPEGATQVAQLPEPVCGDALCWWRLGLPALAEGTLACHAKLRLIED